MVPARKIFISLLAAVLLALLYASCRVITGQAPPLSTGSTPTSAPPTLTVKPSSPPTVDPWRLPEPDPEQQPGSDWKTYVNVENHVQFSYPPDWVEKAPGQLEGPGGFARLWVLPNDGAGPGAICQGESNRGKPDAYGAYPLIFNLRGASAGSSACLILSSPGQRGDRRGESLYLLWPPAQVEEGALLALSADRQHIFPITNSLRLTGQDLAQTPTTTAAQCGEQVGQGSPEPLNQGGLRIDQYPIARAADCSPTRQPQIFDQLASAGSSGSRAAQLLNGQWRSERLSGLNAQLRPFGVRIQTAEKLFAIYKDGALLRANLNWIGQLSVNASGSDFRLPVVDSYNSATYMVHAGGIEPLEAWDILLYDKVFPVFVGDDLISLAYDYQRYPRPVNNPALLDVKKNGEVIETLSVNGSSTAGGPVRGLWSWENHWVIELPGLVIQDGQILNDELGYSEMFTWRLLNGKPFYFFRQEGKIYASYNGETLPITYDEVIHQPLSMMGSLVQMRSYDNGLVFYARQGDLWYYVILEAK